MGFLMGLSVEFDRLQEICAAEKDGRCVVLPCKEGDAIFTFGWSIGREKLEIRESVIKHVRYDSRDSEVAASNGEQFGIICSNNKGIGIRAFLTREAAAAALKEPEEKENEAMK